MGRLRRAARHVATRLQLSPRTRALAVVIVGGASTAIGTGLVYVPAGVILAGVELVVFGLIVLDVPRAR